MPPSAALQRLKEAQRARQTGGVSGGRQQSHFAATSDADNEAYMQEFEEAFSSLSAAGQLSTLQPHAIVSSHPVSEQPLKSNKTGRSGNAQAALRSGVQQRELETGVHAGARFHASCTRSRRLPLQAVAAKEGESSSQCRMADNSAGTLPKTPAPSWCTGPTNDAGVLVQLSDRPLMCSAANWASNEVVVGCSDHALYVVDIGTGKKRRTLYSKTMGHTEWVTSVCYLPGGRVLTGGMDGRLWLWPASGCAGTEVRAAHTAPVSKVSCLTNPSAAPIASSSSSGSRREGFSSSRVAAAEPVLAVSCSYDKSVKIWDVTGGSGKQVAVLTGHSGPVLELAVDDSNSSIATGDRKGCLICWDLASGSSSWRVAAAHQGHITALAWQQDHAAQAVHDSCRASSSNSSGYLISGGQDGCVAVWHGRTGSCVARQAVHVNQRGKGAVGNIVIRRGSSGCMVVTAGADMTVRVLDPRLCYQPIHTVQLTDFPYTLASVGPYALCGCGDGSVHVVDVDNGATLYALGAGKAAIRALEASADKLVCAGDDGCVVIYEIC